MTIFYRGPGAHITHELFEVRSPHCQSFRIRDLKYVHVVQEEAEPLGNPTLVKVGSSSLAGVATTVAIIGWGVFGEPRPAIAALVLIAISLAISAGCWRTRERPYELRATYRGRLVCLLRTTDKHVLGQVCRALLRALERNVDY